MMESADLGDGLPFPPPIDVAHRYHGITADDSFMAPQILKALAARGKITVTAAEIKAAGFRALRIDLDDLDVTVELEPLN